MKIEKIEWKNIFSYGENMQTIDFTGDPKLWMMTGVSGAGKTSFLTIPKLLFFGRSEGSDGKTFKVDNVANRINKHGFIRGTVTTETDTYIIERSFAPSGLVLYKNGEKVDIAGVKNVQDVIESEVLDGMSYNIFSNVLTLSLNNFTSFVSMTPKEKRDIIDKVFALELLNKVHELIKKDMNDLGKSINEYKVALHQIDVNINNTTAEIERCKPVDKTGLGVQYDEYKAKLAKVAELHTQQTSLYTEYYSKYSEIQTAENSLRMQITKENTEIGHINSQIKLFNEDKCPTCGTPFTGAAFDQVRTDLEKSLNEHQDVIAQANSQIEQLQANKAEYQSVLTKIQSNLSTLQSKSNEFSTQMRLIESELNRPDEHQSLQNIITKNNEEKKTFEEKIVTNNKEFTLLSYLEQMYSESGIKKMMMDNYVPMLNEEILEILDFINFPYTLQFDGNFDPHLKSLGEEITPASLSCGEHKKVDIAVLCAILKVTKKKYPQINLVCLDETVSSLDYESSVAITKCLKHISEEMGLNVFVVSHTTLEESLFDEHLHVEKPNGFSQISFIRK